MGRQVEQIETTIAIAAQESGLSVRVVQHCIREGLVGMDLGEAELERLRRIRRLRALGINPHGIEIILRMRRQIEHLQAQLARMEQQCPTDE
jgi:DNA-binding transcriptional MerR regulator